MKPFGPIESHLVPLPIDNIDTDQIIPALFLKTISKDGLDRHLFHHWRYDSGGNPRPDFILNQPRSRGASILLAGDNFGCGSSREHAPWALAQFGFRAIISTSFADIFCHNALKNSLLPVIVSHEIHRELLSVAEAEPEARVRIDLASQTIRFPGGKSASFPIEPFAKYCLLHGLDELGFIRQQEPAIASYEAGRILSIDTASGR